MSSGPSRSDGPPSVVTYRIGEQIVIDYCASTGLKLRQLPVDLREYRSECGDVTSATAAFSTRSIAVNPGAWFLGTRAQLGAQLGLSDRQTSRYFSAGSMDWVAEYRGLCAAPHQAVLRIRGELAANLHSSETKRANSAGTARDAGGRFRA